MLNKVSNHKVYDQKQATFYVGFLLVTKRDSKQKGIQGKQIICENTPVYEKKTMDQRFFQHALCN